MQVTRTPAVTSISPAFANLPQSSVRPRNTQASLDCGKLNHTKPFKQVFGERFVSAYQEVKENEMEQYRKVISSWEREHLLLNV